MSKHYTKENKTTNAPNITNMIDTIEHPVTKSYVRLLYNQLTKFSEECACTSAEMSKRLNKSVGYFSKIESRKAFPSMETFLDFCTVCKIHPREFFDAGFDYSYQARDIADKLSTLTEAQINLIQDLVEQFTILNAAVETPGRSADPIEEAASSLEGSTGLTS